MISATDLPREERGAVMRFHAMREPEMVYVLRAMGAQTRLLGEHIMLPIVMDFQNFPKSMLSFEVPKAEALQVVQTVEQPTLEKKVPRNAADQFI